MIPLITIIWYCSCLVFTIGVLAMLAHYYLTKFGVHLW